MVQGSPPLYSTQEPDGLYVIQNCSLFLIQGQRHTQASRNQDSGRALTYMCVLMVKWVFCMKSYFTLKEIVPYQVEQKSTVRTKARVSIFDSIECIDLNINAMKSLVFVQKIKCCCFMNKF